MKDRCQVGSQVTFFGGRSSFLRGIKTFIVISASEIITDAINDLALPKAKAENNRARLKQLCGKQGRWR